MASVSAGADGRGDAHRGGCMRFVRNHIHDPTIFAAHVRLAALRLPRDPPWNWSEQDATVDWDGEELPAIDGPAWASSRTRRRTAHLTSRPHRRGRDWPGGRPPCRLVKCRTPA